MALYWIIAVSFAGGLTSLLLASIIFKNANAALTNSMSQSCCGHTFGSIISGNYSSCDGSFQNNFHGISFAVSDRDSYTIYFRKALMIWRHCHGSHCHKHTECEVESKAK